MTYLEEMISSQATIVEMCALAVGPLIHSELWMTPENIDMLCFSNSVKSTGLIMQKGIFDVLSVNSILKKATGKPIVGEVGGGEVE